MNKSEFIAKLAKGYAWDKAHAELALDGVLGVIKEALAAGEDITLVGFGTFTVAAKPENITGRLKPVVNQKLTARFQTAFLFARRIPLMYDCL